jgi:hypothetical protein
MDDGSSAVGTTLVRNKKHLVALGTLPGENGAAIGAHFGAGDELHLTPGTGKDQLEMAA